MIVVWIVYGLVISVLTGIAALAVERGVQLFRWPLRWVWGGAMVMIAVLVALAPTRAPRHFYMDSLSAQPTATRSLTELPEWLMEVRSPLVEGVSGLAWLISSVVLSLVLASVVRRAIRARDRWPEGEIGGVSVHLSPSSGPAVFGFSRPWIVVPAWLLERPAKEQQMVVDHEAEHLRVGDHKLLAAAWVAIVLMPWNVVLWWMAHRLRVAIEIDCDRRMLQRGVSAHTYGLLLIDVASEYQGLPLGGTRFASRPSQLERRIRAMKPLRTRFVGLRLGAFATVAAGALMVASSVGVPDLTSSAVGYQFNGYVIDVSVAPSRLPAAPVRPFNRTVTYRIGSHATLTSPRNFGGPVYTAAFLKHDGTGRAEGRLSREQEIRSILMGWGPTFDRVEGWDPPPGRRPR